MPATYDPDQTIFNISDLQQAASKKLAKPVRDYFNDGANDMLTLRDNEEAFNRYKLRPRVLRNTEHVDMTCSIWGATVAFPFGFSPAAMHKLAHPDGEIATSRAAAKFNIPMGLSSWATTSIEEVIAEGKDNPYAFQISILKDKEVTAENVRRAEKAGCKAILLTLDAPHLGRRWNESRNKFNAPEDTPFPHLQGPRGNLGYGGPVYENNLGWAETMAFVRERCGLDIWVKGIYTREDVILALEHGVNGIVISNHGGRQLDSVPATLDALRECAPVATGKVPIAIDGGIRRGTDIFKALALGADFCFAGRVPIWGLAYNGQKGVELAIKILQEEFLLCMGLAGCRSVQEINSSHLSVLLPNGVLSKL